MPNLTPARKIAWAGIAAAALALGRNDDTEMQQMIFQPADCMYELKRTFTADLKHAERNARNPVWRKCIIPH